MHRRTARKSKIPTYAVIIYQSSMRIIFVLNVPGDRSKSPFHIYKELIDAYRHLENQTIAQQSGA